MTSRSSLLILIYFSRPTERTPSRPAGHAANAKLMTRCDRVTSGGGKGGGGEGGGDEGGGGDGGGAYLAE